MISGLGRSAFMSKAVPHPRSGHYSITCSS
jgi:hypothetical protein